jgi:hypothetical protein
MHPTLKQDATKPAAANLLQQQARFDAFITRYNEECPDQALEMQVPAALYIPSSRPYRGLDELDYPLHDWTATVTHCGRLCYKGWKINLSHVFAGQNVGVRQVSDRIWLVTFMQYDLGCFDDETCRLEPIENPFGPKVLTHVFGMICHPCDRNGPAERAVPSGNRYLVGVRAAADSPRRVIGHRRSRLRPDRQRARCPARSVIQVECRE